MKHMKRLITAVLVLTMLWTGLYVPARAEEAGSMECTGYGVLAEEAQGVNMEEPDHLGVTYSPEEMSTEAIYNRMIAKKAEYPEGMRWTNDNYYAWNGGYFSGGYGCAGFAFILSDAGFGDLPARKLATTDFESIRVGDILRINNNSHSVIVLEVRESSVIVAEGNYNRSIHWGRELSKENLEYSLTYIMTRYETDPGEEPKVEFEDVEAGAYYEEAVQWAVANDITNGYGSSTTFCPDLDCTRGQVVTFLWRAKGCPEPVSLGNPFTDVTVNDFYYKAVLWAVEQGITNGYGSDSIFNPDGKCTRGQVATFLWRAEGKPAVSNVQNSFTDVERGEYYYEAVLWAVEKGVTNGYGSAETFCPNIICNRGQIVTFLYRGMK